MGHTPLLYILAAGLAAGLALARVRTEEGEDFRSQPKDEWPAGQSAAPSPYILYGPHGYQTFPHSRCQEVSITVPLNRLSVSLPRYQPQR